jgi:hypothetical protein
MDRHRPQSRGVMKSWRRRGAWAAAMMYVDTTAGTRTVCPRHSRQMVNLLHYVLGLKEHAVA